MSLDTEPRQRIHVGMEVRQTESMFGNRLTENKANYSRQHHTQTSGRDGSGGHKNVDGLQPRGRVVKRQCWDDASDEKSTDRRLCHRNCMYNRYEYSIAHGSIPITARGSAKHQCVDSC